MNTKEWREKSIPDLNKELLALRREQLNLRIQRRFTQTPKSHLFKKVHSDIALIKTILKEKIGIER